jgi:glucose/arabinose dehydrogenase
MRVPIWSAACLLAFTTAAGAQSFNSSAGALKVETVVGGLVHPWALAFLPNGGNMLITERPGRLRIATPDGKLTAPIEGVPKVFASGQGGLHDVVLDRDFGRNRTIYFCYAEPARGDGGGQTALARAQLVEEGAPRLDGVRTIFRQEGPPSSGNHFGCRIVQARDGNLFLTMGDHFTARDEAQKLSNHIGKIVRIAPDGAVPKDNPFVGRDDAKPEIWSYGHRNSQGAALHPTSGKLWMHEHGPRGGDEVNIPEKGKNYGWPVIGFGIDYSGAKIHQSTNRSGMEQPVKYWVPSIAPSGMAFYQGDLFPAWRGSLFVGALSGRMVARLALDGEKVTGEERLLQGLRERIRDVRAGPDGALYLVTDNAAGRVLRVVPAK